MLKRKCLTVLTITLLILSNIGNRSIAATQGELDSTSTGNVDISLPLGDAVSISYIDDLVFPQWGGSGNLLEIDDICIFSNTTGGGYNITATGSGSGGAFTVTDGTNVMAYNLYWNDVAGTNTGAVQITTPNVALTGQTGASTTSSDCNGGTNLTARFGVQFTNAVLGAAVISIYTGSITFQIAPE